MAQALNKFFQRTRSDIHDAITEQMAPSMLTTRQNCLTWVGVHPNKHPQHLPTSSVSTRAVPLQYLSNNPPSFTW